MHRQHKLYNFISISLISAFIYQSAAFIPVDLTFLTSLPNKIAAAFAQKPKPEKVELKNERTQNSKTFLNPNGTYTTEISQQDINYQDKNGQMKPIDTTLEKNTNGYKIDKNSIQAEFSDKANDLIKITNPKDNTSIDYKIADADKTKINPIKKSGNKLSYENYKKDTTLNYTIKNGQVKEEIVLDKPPADNTFTFELDLKGLKPEEQKDGSISLFDEEKRNNKAINPKIRNKPSMIIEVPFMTDSKLNDLLQPTHSDSVDMKIKQKKGSVYILKVTADKRWLDDPARVYPVKIDPTFSVQQSSILDTYMSSDQTQQYVRANEDRMYAGSNNRWPEHRALFRFDTSFIPKDANISSARVHLYQADPTYFAQWNYATNSGTSTTIYRITSDWDKNITWNSMVNNFTTPWVGNPVYNNNMDYWFDVTGIAQGWQNGSVPNYGFMALSNAGYFISFWTYESSVGDQYKPKLEVTYTLNRVGRESYRTYKDYSGVSVDVQTGNAIVEGTDVSIAGRGPATHISHIYNSQDTSTAQLRQGFTLNTDLFRASYNGTSTAIVTTETGARHTYNKNADGSFTRPGGVDEDLIIENGFLTLKRKDGSKVVFASDGRISKEIDKNANTLTYDYSTLSVTAITDALGRVTKIYYNSDATVNKIVDFADRTTSFTYVWHTNGNTSKVTITNSAGEGTTYNYDVSGKLLNLVNPAGKTTSIAYDTESKVKSVTNPLGKAMSFSYTLKDVEVPRNFLLNPSFEEGLNNWAHFGSLNQASYTVPNPIFGNYYFETNLINSSNGRSWYQDYLANNGYGGANAVNNINAGTPYTFSVYVRSPGGTHISGTLALWGLYGTNPNQSAGLNFSTSSTEWQRISTTLVTNQKYGALRAEIYLDGQGNYDFDGAQLEKNAFASSFIDDYVTSKPREVSYTTATDPKGNKSTYYFNSEGLVSKVGEPIGSTSSTAADAPLFPDYTIEVPGQPDVDLDDYAEDEYDEFELDAEADMADTDTQDPVDIITIPFIQGEVPKPEVSQPLAEGTVTQYQYDSNFNVKTIIEKDNTFTTFEYDSRGNKTKETEHDHNYPETGSAATDDKKHRTTIYAYDANNNLTSQTSPTGKTTTYEYDTKGNLISESSLSSVDGQRSTTTYTYDSYGNQIAKTDPEGNKTLDPNDYTTTNVYDANNNLIQVTDATGVTTYYTYDEVSNKIAERKEGQDITSYSYDSLGRIISQKSAANDKGFSLNKYYYNADSSKSKDEAYAVNVETDQTSAWYNNSWQKRVPIEIDNTNNSQSLTDYQIKVTVPYAADMNSDFSDLRFTADDKITSIPYWIESKKDLAQATVWIKVPVTAASSSKNIYMYYANYGATSASNGSAVFESFDIGAPKGYWSFSDGAALDQIVGNNGSVYGSTVASGKYDNALNFDGVDDYLQIPANNNYAFGTSDFSVEMWVNPSQLAGDHRVFLANSLLDNFQIAYNANNADIEFYAGGNGTSGTAQAVFSSSLSWSLGSWYYIVVTRESGAVKIYRDGTEVGSGNSTANIGNHDLYIGRRAYSIPSHPFNGCIDEVKIYNKSLSSTEVSALYSNQPEKMGSIYNVRKHTAIEPTVNVGTLKSWNKYTYDSAGQLTEQENQIGAKTLYEYDSNGNKTAEKRLQKYDANNNPIYSITNYVYDELNRLTKETRPDRSWTAYAYDSFGNVTKEGTPEGTTVNIYDKAKNQIATASSDRTVTKSIYDKEGNEVITGDSKDIATATNYDANGNIVKVADAANQRTNYSYDANQNETTVTAPDGSATTTAYNEANQVKVETDQSNQSTTTNYNASGQESTINQPNSQDQSMQYGDNGNLTDINAAGTTTNSTDTITTDDALGNPQAITTDVAGASTQELTKINTEYDSADRITKTTDAQNMAVNYYYDYLNNITKIVSSTPGGEGQGEGITYGYDTASKLTSVTDPNNQTTNFNYEQGTLNGATYDKSNISKITLPNSVQTDYTYAKGSKVTQLSNTKNGDTLSNYSYEYDMNGNITKTMAKELGWPRSIFSDDFAILNPLNWTNMLNASHDLINGQLVMNGETNVIQDTWFNQSWLKRTPLTINNIINPQPLTDYQVKLNVSFEMGMKADFSDLRFTDRDKVTQIPYWIESKTDSTSAIVWVKVPNIRAYSSETIYMYYGNFNAISVSNGSSTFDFFDDFNRDSIGSNWTVPSGYGNWSIVNNTLRAAGGTGYEHIIQTTNPSSGGLEGKAIELKIKNRYGFVSDNQQQGLQLNTTPGYSLNFARWLDIGGVDQWDILVNPNRSASSTDTSFDASAWHNYTLEKYNSEWKLLVDDNLKVARTDAWNPTYFSLFSYFNPDPNYNNGNPIWTDFDDFRIRKYTSIEPIISIGASTPLKSWLDEDWLKRAQVMINNDNNSQSLTNYQVKITVPYQAGMKADFSDLRFTDEDKITQISHWVESKTDSNQATVWVKVPQVSANSNKTIYMYYSNPDAVSKSNGSNTFDFFDDFNSGSISSNWTVPSGYGNWNIYNNRLRASGGSRYEHIIQTTNPFSGGLEGKAIDVEITNRYGHVDDNQQQGIQLNTAPGYSLNFARWLDITGADQWDIYVDPNRNPSATSGSFDASQSHKYTLEKHNNNWKMLVDDDLKATRADVWNPTYFSAYSYFNPDPNYNNGNLIWTDFDNFRVRKYTSIEPVSTIGTSIDSASAYVAEAKSYSRDNYPVIKTDFKVDNSSSGLYVKAKGTKDGQYRSLGLKHEGDSIFVKKTEGQTTIDKAIPLTSTLLNTFHTAEFEFSPTDTKVYVYKKGDPKPAYPAYTDNEGGWNPTLTFQNSYGNAYIDNVEVKTRGDINNYTYDNLNRLTRVSDIGSGVTDYTYDEQGNRLTKADSTGITNYAYDNANQLLEVRGQSSDVSNYTYDANGNTVGRTVSAASGTETTNYTYDNKNQLVKVTKPNGDIVEYVYDGNGNRFKKIVTASTSAAVSTYYSYDTSGNIVSEYKLVNGQPVTDVRYVRDNTGKAISMIQGANTYYFVYNGHGDVAALTNSTGTVVASYSYDEFGNETGNGSGVTGNEIYNPLRYSGAHNAYYDQETGLYKMGVRYYQSDVGRWLTRDEYLGSQEQPQTKNRYVYVENNPLTKVDPSGYMSIPKALSYARKGDILAIVNKKTKAMIPGHYSHVALAFGGEKYGESTLGDGTYPIKSFDNLTGTKNVTEVAVMRVNTSGANKSRAVRYAKYLVSKKIPYVLTSDYRKKSDGMNCSEFVWRSYYIGSRHKVDFTPSRLKPTIVIAPQIPTITPDEIAYNEINNQVALGTK